MENKFPIEALRRLFEKSRNRRNIWKFQFFTTQSGEMYRHIKYKGILLVNAKPEQNYEKTVAIRC